MRKIKLSSRFKKDFKRIRHDKKLVVELEAVLEMLATNKRLPIKYQDHSLKRNLAGFFDCHIKPNVVLIYEKTEAQLLLLRIGSHSELRL